MSREGELELDRVIAVNHGLYYALTGYWAVLHRPSFEFITGRKQEYWLVETAGLLIGLIGTVLTLAGFRNRKLAPELRLLACGTAASLASIDLLYWKRGRLRFIYLLDAIGEIGFLAAWLATWPKERQRSG